MPFVSIRLIEGRSAQQKEEIARRVTVAISEVTGLPRDDVWVVFEEFAAADWYLGDRSVAARRAKPATAAE